MEILGVWLNPVLCDSGCCQHVSKNKAQELDVMNTVCQKQWLSGKHDAAESSGFPEGPMAGDRNARPGQGRASNLGAREGRP